MPPFSSRISYSGSSIARTMPGTRHAITKIAMVESAALKSLLFMVPPVDVLSSQGATLSMTAIISSGTRKAARQLVTITGGLP